MRNQNKDAVKYLHDYDFSEEDKNLLISIAPVMTVHALDIADRFYSRLQKINATKKFLHSEDVIEERKRTLVNWYNSLFTGVYDGGYFQDIKKIGKAHARIGLDSHFINSSMNYLRNLVLEIVEKNYNSHEERYEITRVLQKILDVNLDIMTKSYQEAELKKVFLSHRFESALVGIAERFTYGLNLILVTALMGISVGAVWMFFDDIWHVIRGGEEIGHGMISALGSLLIIWVMIELMETEIEHLKGKAFPAIIFVHVVLVSFIREVLVVSLQHNMQTQMLMVGTAFILGIIYWLVSKAERKSKEEDFE